MINNKIKKIIHDNNYEFIHIKSTTSTMIEVKNYLNQNNKNCIFLSDLQTEGRGQRGNLWVSSEGNMYCSMSFNNFLEINDYFLYNVLIAVSIKLSLEKFGAKKIKFKWPNDLFYEKSKFGGIISEVYNINDNKKYIITGFGININSCPNLINISSTYVKSFCLVDNVGKFLIVFFDILFHYLNDLINKGSQNLINIFKNSLMFKNENIEISLPNKSVIKGVFKDINIDGSLKLETNGNVRNIYNGSIKV